MRIILLPLTCLSFLLPALVHGQDEFTLSAQVQPAAGILVPVGEPWQLEASTDMEVDSYFWQKNRQTLLRSNSYFYSTPFANTSSVGLYRVGARLGSRTAYSRQVPVAVYEPHSGGQVIVVDEGQPVTFTSRSWGPRRKFRWTRADDLPLESLAPYITGVSGPTLHIKSASLGDMMGYTCRLWLESPDPLEGVISTEPVELALVDLFVRPRPRTVIGGDRIWHDIENNQYLLESSLGEQFTSSASVFFALQDLSELGIEPSLLEGVTNGTLIVRDLPPGVRYEADSNRLIGAPTRPGTYRIKVIGRNSIGEGPPSTLVWVVNPLDMAMIGRYTGLVEPARLTQRFGGALSLQMTALGVLSGEVNLAHRSLPFTGRVTATRTLDMDPELPPRYTASVSLGSGMGMNLVFAATSGTWTLMGQIHGSPPWVVPPAEQRQDGSVDVLEPDVVGVHVVQGNSPYRGYFTAQTSYQAGEGLLNVLPMGFGLTGLTLLADGQVVVAGKLPDGTAFTKSSAVGGNGLIPLYVLVQKDAGYLAGGVPYRGRVLGWISSMPQSDEDPSLVLQAAAVVASQDFSEIGIGYPGVLSYWLKPASSRLARHYPGGFGFNEQGFPQNEAGCTLYGRKYYRPAAPQNLFEIPATTENLVMELAHPDLLSPQNADTGLRAAISAPATITPDNRIQARFTNRFRPTFRVDVATGRIKGTVRLERLSTFGNLVVESITYDSILISRVLPGSTGTHAIAVGQYSLPELADPLAVPPTTAVNSPVFCWPMRILPTIVPFEGWQVPGSGSGTFGSSSWLISYSYSGFTLVNGTSP